METGSPVRRATSVNVRPGSPDTSSMMAAIFPEAERRRPESALRTSGLMPLPHMYCPPLTE